MSGDLPGRTTQTRLEWLLGSKATPTRQAGALGEHAGINAAENICDKHFLGLVGEVGPGAKVYDGCDPLWGYVQARKLDLWVVDLVSAFVWRCLR